MPEFLHTLQAAPISCVAMTIVFACLHLHWTLCILHADVDRIPQHTVSSLPVDSPASSRVAERLEDIAVRPARAPTPTCDLGYMPPQQAQQPILFQSDQNGGAVA